MRPIRPPMPANRDRLDVLGTQNRAAASSSGMAAIMRNRGIPNSILSRDPNRRDEIVRAQAHLERGLSFLARRAAILLRRFEPYGVFPGGISIDDKNGQFGRPPNEHDGVAPAAFARDRKTAADQRVVDAFCQRTLADNGEL